MNSNRNIFISSLLCVFLIGSLSPLQAQEEQEEQEDVNAMKPARPAFENGLIIDNQTSLVPSKGTLEFMIQHRFGTVENGISDLYGLYAPSNIRMGFSYTIWDKYGAIAIGYGFTKDNRIQDFSVKYAFLKQTRGGKIPVSVTYYGNMGIMSQGTQEELPNGNNSDRFSYFHQLIISRRISPKLSIQISPSLTHYNVVEPQMKNDHIAIAFAGRFKFSDQSAIVVNVDQPITKHTLYNPQPNVSIGIEVTTSAHTFQIFATNFSAIVPQQNNMFNKNDPWDGDFRIGFNIGRLWNF
jgi:hypothetical protein